jgi:hypothetical protein
MRFDGWHQDRMENTGWGKIMGWLKILRKTMLQRIAWDLSRWLLERQRGLSGWKRVQGRKKIWIVYNVKREGRLRQLVMDRTRYTHCFNPDFSAGALTSVNLLNRPLVGNAPAAMPAQ